MIAILRFGVPESLRLASMGMAALRELGAADAGLSGDRRLLSAPLPVTVVGDSANDP